MHVRGRVDRDMQLHPKPCPITSPDRTGLPDFWRATSKNMGPRHLHFCLVAALTFQSVMFKNGKDTVKKISKLYIDYFVYRETIFRVRSDWSIV